MTKQKKNKKDIAKEDIIKFVEKLKIAAIKEKEESGVYDLYKRGLEYYKGLQKISTNTERKGNLVWNKMAEILTNRISNVVDVRPKWTFKPQDNKGDVFTANALEQIIGDIVWDDTEWADKGEDSMLEAAFAGSSHIKTSVRMADGFPQNTVIPCSMIFPSPKATNKRNLRYIFHVIPKSVTSIKNDYKVEVMPECNLETEQDGKSMDDVGTSFLQQSATSFEMPNIWDTMGFKKDREYFSDPLGMALIWELWIEDETLERIPFDEREVTIEHDQMGEGKFVEVSPVDNHIEHVKRHTLHIKSLSEQINPAEFESAVSHLKAHYNYEPFKEYRKKYPLGRVISTCQDKLLDDKENPLPIHWKNVFTKWDWWKLPLSYWAKPLTKDLFDPQDALNHRKNAITRNINNQNNGVVLVDRGLWKFLFSKSNKKKLNSGIEGHVLPVSSSTSFSRDNGPSLPAHVVRDPDATEGFMERNSGNEGISAGRLPKGSPAGVTVEQLLSQSQKPTNTVINHYSFALQQMARNAIAIMIKYVDPDKLFRILGDDNNFKFIKWGDLKDKAGIYDIRVDVIGRMSSSREKRFERAILLAKEGHYDTQAVLEEDEDPKKFEIMQRMDIVRQLKMANQALMEMVDTKDKENNSLRNAAQGSSKEGNVGK
jgi:hypothetical protein